MKSKTRTVWRQRSSAIGLNSSVLRFEHLDAESDDQMQDAAPFVRVVLLKQLQ
jgi:hypothetical protein